MRKTIYLVRHGHIDNPDQVFYNSDIPLSKSGAKEMLAIAEDIQRANGDPSKIIASPYLRTRESAETIAQTFGIQEVIFDERLVDWQVHDWIGKPLEAFREFVGYNRTPFEPNFYGIETYKEMATRVLAVITETIHSLEEGQCAILVSHREPLASTILQLKELPDSEMRAISLPTGSAWKLQYTNEALESLEKAFDHSQETT